jgi:hypothetical protein
MIDHMINVVLGFIFLSGFGAAGAGRGWITEVFYVRGVPYAAARSSGRPAISASFRSIPRRCVLTASCAATSKS